MEKEPELREVKPNHFDCMSLCGKIYEIERIKYEESDTNSGFSDRKDKAGKTSWISGR